MKRWLTITAAAILIAAVFIGPSAGAFVVSASSTSVVPSDAPIRPKPRVKPKAKPKPQAVKPVVLLKPTYVSGTLVADTGKQSAVFSGGFRLKGRLLPATVKWSGLKLEDASGAPLPVGVIRGVGRSIKVPIAGAYRLAVSFTVSTPKVVSPAAKAHQAATRTQAVQLVLGGYNVVGTNNPILQPREGAQYPYLAWSRMLEVNDGLSTTIRLPQIFLVGVGMGTCRIDSLPAGPPIDVVPPQNRGNGVSDGTVTTTGLTVYGQQVVCDNGKDKYFAIPQMWVRFWYADVNGPGWTKIVSTCELPLAGVTSFTVPPEWGGWVNTFASLLTFDPSGKLYNANQFIEDKQENGRWLKGTINPCEAFNLPPMNTSGIYIYP